MNEHRCPTCGTKLTRAKHLVTARDKAQSPVRVDCGYCGHNVKVLTDGIINKHGPYDDRCPGSGDEVL